MKKIGNRIRVISIDYALSPKTFYSRYLNELKLFFKELKLYPGERDLCLDFTNCENIDGNVIPNILVTGDIIKKCIGKPVQMYVQPKSKVSAFLKGINFYNVNSQQYIYELIPDTSEDKNIYQLPDYCTTSMFNTMLNEEQVAVEVVKKYADLFSIHLQDFVYIKESNIDDKVISVNIMEVFCKQICYNSITHGLSTSYLTMQVNYSHNVVLISFADCGKGFYLSLKDKIIAGEYLPVALTKELIEITTNPSLRMYILSILESVVYRFNSIYGIWFVLIDVMRLNGIIRIHTGPVRISFCNINVEILETCRSKKEAFKYLYQFCIENQENIQRTPYYMGVHIEIEIPLKKQE